VIDQAGVVCHSQVWPRKLVIPMVGSDHINADVLKSLAESMPSGIVRITIKEVRPHLLAVTSDVFSHTS